MGKRKTKQPPGQKFSDEIVLTIKQMRGDGVRIVDVVEFLQEHFGVRVSKSMVSAIARDQYRRDVPNPDPYCTADHRSKLTEREVRWIYTLCEAGMTLKKIQEEVLFKAGKDISESEVSRIRDGKRWTNIHRKRYR